MVVEGVNRVYKHLKPSQKNQQGGRLSKEMPIDVSNVMLYCPACARGDKHPNYLLAFTEKGRRRCLYVPRSMIPVLKRALENGRRIERLLYQMGPVLLRDYRARNPPQTGPAVRLKSKNTKTKS